MKIKFLHQNIAIRFLETTQDMIICFIFSEFLASAWSANIQFIKYFETGQVQWSIAFKLPKNGRNTTMITIPLSYRQM